MTQTERPGSEAPGPFFDFMLSGGYISPAACSWLRRLSAALCRAV